MLHEITSLDQFNAVKTQNEFFLLGFYNDKSDNAKEAMKRLDAAHDDFSDTPVYVVNATNVRDIHPLLGVNSVPTILALKKGAVAKNIQGLQSKEHYEMLFYDAPVHNADGSEKKQPSVMVYSTPTCSWCNRLKQYLRKNRVLFSDIDVSRDQNAAKELVNRTGQMGVPQTNIGGEWIVGFDQAKFDKLLGIGK
jgi:glutaredoxin-like YruB-family protein